MPSISYAPQSPQPAPAPTDWFAQNAPPQTYTPVNQTQPGGDPGGVAPVPYGNDTRLNPLPQPSGPTGGTLSPAEVLNFLSQFGTDYDSVRAADAAGRAQYGAAWPQLLDHATKLDKWQFPNGEVYDLVNASGSPGATWVSRAVPEMHGGGGHMGGMGGGGTLGGMFGMGGGGAIPGLNPMLDFMQEQSQRGMERGAAARGILQTGGFQKALGEHLQKNALAIGWQPAFNNNFQLADLGLRAVGAGNQAGTSYGTNLTNLGTNYGNQTTDLVTGQGNANAGANLAQGQNWAGTLGNLANIWGSYPWGGVTPPGGYSI